MDSTALYDQFRLLARDPAGNAPLWSDPEIYLYLDEAQKEFCRLTGGIADATSSVARLKARANIGFASVSPLVLKLRSIFDENGRAMQLLNFEDLEASSSGGSEIFDMTTGPVRYAILGMDPNKVRLVKVPAEDTTFNMIVYRLPLDAIAGPGQELEIAEQHHLALLKWAMHLAHTKADAETYDRGRSEQFRQEFVLYCDQASGEKARREHKYRAVSYGGL